METWINPNKAKLPKKEQDAWVALMSKHHPEIDWKKLMQELNDAKGTGRKSKKD